MLSIYIIGDASQPEFRRAIASMSGTVELATFSDLSTLSAVEGDAPDLILFLQSRPGQFTTADLSRLRRTFPLSRACVVYDAWSEGETQTGEPLPGVLRVHAQNWSAFWRSQQDRLAAGQSPAWRLPDTAAAEEHWLQRQHWPRLEGTVAILARSREAYAALAEACETCGLSTVWRRAVSERTATPVRAILWSDVSLIPAVEEVIKELKNSSPGAPLIALAHFPRPADQEHLLAAGAAAVLPLPLAAQDLWQVLQLV